MKVQTTRLILVLAYDALTLGGLWLALATSAVAIRHSDEIRAVAYGALGLCVWNMRYSSAGWRGRWRS